jgi:D-serine deaminase-like pyridoxal phosphate-dependent protein
MTLQDIPTPAIAISGPIVRSNLTRMAEYARRHRLALRPHTKTHKSRMLARMQLEQGAAGLTVAKVGEARVMAEAADDVLMAYPAVDRARCAELAQVAARGGRTMRVGIDSVAAADALGAAARQAGGTTIGILVDLDVGHHRTGMQNAAEAIKLAQHVAGVPGLRLDGLMFFPGHLSQSADNDAALRGIDEKLGEVLDGWRRSGLRAQIVSGGSTPTAYQSHLVSRMTEIRPGTYVYNDVNSLRCGCAALEDCAARIVCTVVSTAVPGQVVLDAGSKTLTSDRCGPAPDSGHGYVVEYPDAKVTKLSEEHAQVDVSACERRPNVGDRATVIPNHICPCINLQDSAWWFEQGWEGHAERLRIDARGMVF